MAQQFINYGTPPKGEDGDNRRVASEKLEANDAELYAGMAAAQAAAASAQTTANSALTAAIGLKNKLINGNFDFWQRGTGFNAVGYTADRWYLNVNAVTGPSLNQGVFAIGDSTAQPLNATYYLGTTMTGNTDAAGHYMNVLQRVEGVRTLAGKTATLSIRVYNATGAVRPIAVEFAQSFGAGGSAQVTGIGAQQVSLPIGWSTVIVTADIPSIAGKTIGTGDNLALIIWLSAGTTYNARASNLGARTGPVYFAGAQLEEGAYATPFEIRPTQVEFAMCQRYYEKRGAWLAGYNAASGTVGFDIPFVVPKRVAPTITWPSASYANCSGISATTVESVRLIAQYTVTAAGAATFNGSWAADAEL